MSEESTEKTTEVESALRSQREHWREISNRIARIPSSDLPPDPPKRLLFFGLGSSHFAAQLSAYSLLRDRLRAHVPVQACSAMGIGHEVIPQRGDWAFALTHRGQSPATQRAMELCEQAGAFSVQVSAQGVEPTPFARYLLETTPLERCEPHTMSVTGAICAITTLLLGPRVVEEWDALRSIGDPPLELMQRRAGKGPTILLGEWEAEWIAREAALKFMEMARIPVRAYSTEEYFHGPRFATKPEDRIWHVGMSKDARSEEVRAVHRVGVFGASPVAYIPALVELQWLALGTAMNLGMNPDQPEA